MTAIRNIDDGNGSKIVYWHRELPPLNADLVAEHTVEAASGRVPGTISHRDELWDRCYQQLMANVQDRLAQEIARLGGHYAHVLDESIDIRHDDAAGEEWLQRFEMLIGASDVLCSEPVLPARPFRTILDGSPD